MRTGALVLLFAAAGTFSGPAAARGAETLLAADAAVYAPADFKRQIVRHRAQLMQGVADAGDADDGKSSPAAHRAAAAKGARALARKIRAHAAFADVAYDLGAVIHECAAASGVPQDAPGRAAFAGFPPDPFRDPDALLALRDGSGGWNAAVTRATRLIAWIWKSAGGDASIAAKMPEAKGPYPVRE